MKTSTIPAAAILLGLLTAGSLHAVESPGQMLRAELNGSSMAKASADALVKALKKAVARNPARATSLLREVLSVERPDMPEIVDELVAAAIEGLGPNPPADAVGTLVATAIGFQPQATAAIVVAAVRVSPETAAPTIIYAAIVATPGANKELAQELIRAAQLAKPGVLNVALLQQAANKALAVAGSTDGKQIATLKNTTDFKNVLDPIAEGPTDATDATDTFGAVDAIGFGGVGVPIEEFPRVFAPVVLAPEVPPASL